MQAYSNMFNNSVSINKYEISSENTKLYCVGISHCSVFLPHQQWLSMRNEMNLLAVTMLTLQSSLKAKSSASTDPGHIPLMLLELFWCAADGDVAPTALV